MALASVRASAQLSDAEYSTVARRVAPGATIFVTTRTAGEIRGRLVRLTPDAVVITADGAGEQVISFGDVAWMERRGDPIWDGALIGGSIWGFGSLAGAGASCSPDCASVVPAATAIGVGVGAAFGAAIDWLIPGRMLVYGDRDRPKRGPSPGTSLASLWSHISPGDRVAVRTAGGAEINGRFVRASASSVVVAMGGTSQEIPASEVLEVRRYRGGTHAKKGFLIGLALGALSGTRACYSDLNEPYPTHDSGLPCGLGVAVGAAGGGAIGAWLGRVTFGSDVAYRVTPIASPHGIAVMATFAY